MRWIGIVFATCAVLASGDVPTQAATVEEVIAKHVEARGGREAWEGIETMKLTGEFTASPISYGGNLFCANEAGDTHVIEAADTFKRLHTNSLDEMIMATPAIAGDRLIVRTIHHLYSIRKPAAQ